MPDEWDDLDEGLEKEESESSEAHRIKTDIGKTPTETQVELEIKIPKQTKEVRQKKKKFDQRDFKEIIGYKHVIPFWTRREGRKKVWGITYGKTTVRKESEKALANSDDELHAKSGGGELPSRPVPDQSPDLGNKIREVPGNDSGDSET